MGLSLSGTLANLLCCVGPWHGEKIIFIDKKSATRKLLILVQVATGAYPPRVGGEGGGRDSYPPTPLPRKSWGGGGCKPPKNQLQPGMSSKFDYNIYPIQEIADKMYHKEEFVEMMIE